MALCSTWRWCPDIINVLWSLDFGTSSVYWIDSTNVFRKLLLDCCGILSVPLLASTSLFDAIKLYQRSITNFHPLKLMVFGYYQFSFWSPVLATWYNISYPLESLCTTITILYVKYINSTICFKTIRLNIYMVLVLTYVQCPLQCIIKL